MKLSFSVIFFLIYGILNAIPVHASRDLQTQSIESFGRLTVRSQCSDYVNRQTLFEEYGIDQVPFYDSSVESTFNFDIEYIQRAIDQGFGQIVSQVKLSAGKIFLYTGAWIIGLTVTLLVWPFLLCCCCCPWSCPPCGRDLSNKPYTKVQILWPSIVSLILLMVILITSIVGISSHHKAQKAFQELACAQGVIFDDFINGNKVFSDQTTYFMGMRFVDSSLREMNNSILAINSQIDKLRESDPKMQDTRSKIGKSKSSTAKVPSLSEGKLVLSYNVPLASAPGNSTSKIESIFPNILGNRSDSSSLVGKAYNSLEDYDKISTQINQSAKSYLQNSANFRTSSIDKVLNEINATFYELGRHEKRSNDVWFQASKFLKNFTIGQYVFYGVLIGLSLLMIISICLLVFCMYSRCRYVMYGICGIFFFLCFLSYIVCIAMSLGNPIAYYSCRYLEQMLNSKAKMASTLTDKLDLNITTAGKISECFASDGNKMFSHNFFGTDVRNSVQSLSTTFSDLIQINSDLVRSIDMAHQNLLKTVDDYKTARINDINDGSAFNQLYKLSVSSQYPCSSDGFQSDSWIPSIYQVDRYVPCSLDSYDTIGIPVDSSSCTSTTNFTSRAFGCSGCMDTFDLFKNNKSSTDIFTALTARYPDASCSSFNQELSNVWSNFYQPKIDMIGPVGQRAITAKNDSDEVIQTTTFFTQIKQNLSTNFSSIFDSQQGLLSSLNCQVAGEDLRLFKNVICQGMPSYAYFMRVVMGIISLCLSVVMCCVVCTGRRNVRQQEWEIVDPERKDDEIKKEKEKYFQQPVVPTTYQQFTFNINGSLQAANNQPGQVNPYSQYACEP